MAAALATIALVSQLTGPLELGPELAGTATHYGVSYHGQRMACGGTYSTYDPSIVAVSPAHYADWSCGQQLQISGPAGSIVVTRADSCPGCSPTMVDLSEAGSELVCGIPAHTCPVVIQEVR